MNTNNANKLTVEQVQGLTAALNTRGDTLDFLVSLAPDERQQRRLSGKVLRAAANRLEAARRHGDRLPAGFDLRRYERDVALTVALEECLASVERIRLRVQDTLQVVGLRGSRAGAEAYAYLKAAANGAGELKQTVAAIRARRRGSAKPVDPAAGTASAPAAGTPPPPKPQNAPPALPPPPTSAAA